MNRHAMRVRNTLIDIEGEALKQIRNEGYRVGWNDRKLHDTGLIEEAIRKSRSFNEFVASLREKLGILDQ